MPYKLSAQLHCDGKELGQFSYSFSSNEDELELVASDVLRPLFPYEFFDKSLSLYEMIRNYEQELKLCRSLPISDYNPSQIVFGTIISSFVEQQCPHFVSNAEVHCSTCNKYFDCKYCHEDSECFSLECDKIRCKACEHEEAISKCTQECSKCKAQLFNYGCMECLVFVSNIEEFPIFHCSECKECIKGYEQDYVTCEKCNECVQKLFFSFHKCESLDEEVCCICHGEFDELIRKKVIFTCKHFMHYSCWVQIGNKCPLCEQDLHQIIPKLEFDDSYLRWLVRISKGEVTRQLKLYKCEECGSCFEFYQPPCCVQPFCKSTDCAECEHSDDIDILHFKEINGMLLQLQLPQIVIYESDEEIKKLFMELLSQQKFWDQFGTDKIQLFLDFCNLLDFSPTWKAICLLINKGYNETDIASGPGLKKEVEICIAQLQTNCI